MAGCPTLLSRREVKWPETNEPLLASSTRKMAVRLIEPEVEKFWYPAKFAKL